MSSHALDAASDDGMGSFELRRPIVAGGRGADPEQLAVDLVDPPDRGRTVAEVDLLRVGRLVDRERPVVPAIVDGEAIALEDELAALRPPRSLERGAVARGSQLLPVGPNGQAVVREDE